MRDHLRSSGNGGTGSAADARSQGSQVDVVLSRIERVRRSGSGWVARCPAHDDRSPSLSVREGADGRVLVYCHAGCRTDDVVAAIGLTMRDLFADSRRQL